LRSRLTKLERGESILVPSVQVLAEDDNSTIKAESIRAGDLSNDPNSSQAADTRFSASLDSLSTLREFETILNASRVYRRAEPNEADMSFRSSVVRSHAWTALSGDSLADISEVSVIALPLSSDEVKAMYHFLLPGHELPPSIEPAHRNNLVQTISDLTRKKRISISTSIKEAVARTTVSPDPRPWRVAILGEGCVGKTALVAEVSRLHPLVPIMIPSLLSSSVIINSSKRMTRP
jgi:hypothetical protein